MNYLSRVIFFLLSGYFPLALRCCGDHILNTCPHPQSVKCHAKQWINEKVNKIEHCVCKDGMTYKALSDCWAADRYFPCWGRTCTNMFNSWRRGPESVNSIWFPSPAPPIISRLPTRLCVQDLILELRHSRPPGWWVFELMMWRTPRVKLLNDVDSNLFMTHDLLVLAAAIDFSYKLSSCFLSSHTQKARCTCFKA